MIEIGNSFLNPDDIHQVYYEKNNNNKWGIFVSTKVRHDTNDEIITECLEEYKVMREAVNRCRFIALEIKTYKNADVRLHMPELSKRDRGASQG